jgi:hypothetical protein
LQPNHISFILNKSVERNERCCKTNIEETTKQIKDDNSPDEEDESQNK